MWRRPVFPQAPNVDGLPGWLQILVSITFLLITGGIAVRGYNKRVEREPGGAAQTVLAHIPDMGPMRHLGDVCTRLSACVESLESATRELTHFLRDLEQTEREVCQRLRELKEEMRRIG